MENKKNRRRRSLAWINVLVKDKLRQAIESNVDSIVLDLEDTLPVSQKEEGRAETARVLMEEKFQGKERVVRINALDTQWAVADLQAVLPAMPDAIRLPKCETVEYVLRLDGIISEFEQSHGLEKNSIGMILMIETPLGIINCVDMAKCSDRIFAIGLGMEDLTTALRVTRSYELNSPNLLYARQKLVIAGRAAGVQVLDSSVLLDDLDFIYQDSVISKQLGYDGRSIVNLNHVDAVNRAYSPSEKEIEWAYKIIDMYDHRQELEEELYYQGLFVDVPVVTKARQILETL